MRQRMPRSPGSDISMCSAGSPDTDVHMASPSPHRGGAPAAVGLRVGLPWPFRMALHVMEVNGVGLCIESTTGLVGHSGLKYT